MIDWKTYSRQKDIERGQYLVIDCWRLIHHCSYTSLGFINQQGEIVSNVSHYAEVNFPDLP